jgi:hypothetical protein
MSVPDKLNKIAATLLASRAHKAPVEITFDNRRALDESRWPSNAQADFGVFVADFQITMYNLPVAKGEAIIDTDHAVGHYVLDVPGGDATMLSLLQAFSRRDDHFAMHGA